MKTFPCRDCGYLLTVNLRGCPRCALNLDAERMIDRIVWRRLVPALIALVVVASGVMILVTR